MKTYTGAIDKQPALYRFKIGIILQAVLFIFLQSAMGLAPMLSSVLKSPQTSNFISSFVKVWACLFKTTTLPAHKRAACLLCD